MAQPVTTILNPENITKRNKLVRSLGAVCLLLIILFAYRWSGLGDIVTPEKLQDLKINVWAPALIILAMAAAWAFALPASPFLFIAPLLFPPHISALITTTGCALGTSLGYGVARFVGGSWVERFRDGRLHRFLTRHSSFMVLFAIRLTPSSPHGFINYGAGLARIPFARFLTATTAALAIKSYVYAVAVHNTVGAKSLFDALTPTTMLSLFAVAVMALIGHLLHQRLLREDGAQNSAARRSA